MNDNQTVEERPIEHEAQKKSPKGVWADGLTLIRLGLTPVIMFVIYKAWSANPGGIGGFISLDLSLVLLASVLFAIAAITDIFDDIDSRQPIEPDSETQGRRLGWIDDIADSVLVLGTLIALVWVLGKADLLHWSFSIPVLILFVRDIVLGISKGYQFSKYGFLESKLGDIKNVFAMLGTCTLVAAPWLSNIIDSLRAERTNNVLDLYIAPSSWVWNTGLVVLWIAAVLAIWTSWALLTSKPNTSSDTSL